MSRLKTTELELNPKPRALLLEGGKWGGALFFSVSSATSTTCHGSLLVGLGDK